MYIITFYSFKGGVGRTMALVNTAAELARRGRKVLLVDFDLEAPGLSTYDILRPPVAQRSRRLMGVGAPPDPGPRPGIVEYVTEFRRTHHSPLVTDFIYEAQPVGKKDGKLWVMPAGRGDAEYRRMLNALSWRTLYAEEEGFLLFEDTRLQWEAELHPDYVLIDARTGHTDIEGICTRQLADAVVIVFHPNEQNLAGLRQVCRHIRAEETSGLKKKIRLHFVASNIPNIPDEEGILDRQLQTFRKELSIPAKAVRIHRYESLKLLEQKVFVLHRPRSRLAQEYRRLMRSIIVCNPADHDGALLFLKTIQEEETRALIQPEPRRQLGEVDSMVGRRTLLAPSASGDDTLDSLWRPKLDELRHKQNKEMLLKIKENFLDDAEVFLEAARYERLIGRWDLVLGDLSRVDQLKPNQPDVLLQRAAYRKQNGDRSGAADDLLGYLRLVKPGWMGLESIVRELVDASLDKFLEALSLPSLHEQFSGPHGQPYWLHLVARILISQRRWQEAIRYLDHTADELVRKVYQETPGEAPYAQFWRLFYLAMAQWGQTGRLRADLCQQGLSHFLSTSTEEDSVDRPATDSQCLSLLWWGVGDNNKALSLVDRAITHMEDAGEFDPDGLSYWTFHEAVTQDFRAHCDQQRRMIRGEPVRPAFLGPQS